MVYNHSLHCKCSFKVTFEFSETGIFSSIKVNEIKIQLKQSYISLTLNTIQSKECKFGLGNGERMIELLNRQFQKRLFNPETEGNVRKKALKIILP